jgi:recombinase, phage RecT family
MATVDTIKAVVSNGTALQKQDKLETLLSQMNIRKRFEEILGAKAPGFISSIISAVNTNDSLKTCDPKTVLGSAVVAATLDLPINGNLGFAAIVPYKGQAQFQMMWKGFVQLGIRTAQYKTMHTSDVYQDEYKSWNPLTGVFETTDPETWKQRDAGETDKIVGYVAYFRLLNGFEKYLYMTVAQVKRHGQKYSKSYSNPNSKWQQDFQAMALKTLIKLLLSKWGILSIEMQKAITVDQAVITDADKGDAGIEYADAKNAQDAEIVPNEKVESAAPVMSQVTGKEIEL